MAFVTEKQREIDIIDTVDVVVLGGGVAGVAAAIASARNGAKTMLVERSFGLGGLATLGNVVIYLALCDGCGRQVIGGLGEELLHCSTRDIRSPNRRLQLRLPPQCWASTGTLQQRAHSRYEAGFNPASFQLELERLISDEGVDILYDTRFCECILDDRGITHVLLENKQGRRAIACKVAIDATGDADVCHRANEPTSELSSNVLAGWHYQYEGDSLTLQIVSKRMNPCGSAEGLDGPLFSGTNERDVTQHVLQTRQWIRQRMEAYRDQHPDADIYPVALASLPAFRMTRRLAGSFTLEYKHAHEWHDDSIGFIGQWNKPGPIWSIPYRCIRGIRNRNLLVAGRCISSSGKAWDSTRAIPACAVTGEAAGTAAALAVRECDGDVHALDIQLLQQALIKQRVILDRHLLQPGSACSDLEPECQAPFH